MRGLPVDRGLAFEANDRQLERGRVLVGGHSAVDAIGVHQLPVVNQGVRLVGRHEPAPAVIVLKREHLLRQRVWQLDRRRGGVVSRVGAVVLSILTQSCLHWLQSTISEAQAEHYSHYPDFAQQRGQLRFGPLLLLG